MSAQKLREAIVAARQQDKQRARDLLWMVIHEEPQNELAWLWLATVLDNLDERIAALENALTINPQREKTRAYLAKLKTAQKEARAAEAEQLFVKAVAQYEGGSRVVARDILRRVVSLNEAHVEAWYLLAQVVSDRADKMIALERVLSLEPTHEKAKRDLFLLREGKQGWVNQAEDALVNGRYDEALTLYSRAWVHTNSAAERLVIEKRMREVERQAAINMRPVLDKTTTLLRLASGPGLLYLLLAFIHVGFQVANLNLQVFLNLLIVLVGSALVVSVHNTPRHKIWRQVFGPAGLQKTAVRWAITLIGLSLILLPYLLLFMNAIDRLAPVRPDLIPFPIGS